MIRTLPPGAKVWVEGKFVGTSPATFVVSRSAWQPVFRCRLEKEGYLTRDCELHEITGKGRIVGAVFSLGISLLFKPVSTLQSDYEFPLQRDPGYGSVAPLP